jgi:hypothetical protein
MSTTSDSHDFVARQRDAAASAGDVSPADQNKAMWLLKAIFDKTGGRGRAVRDITELESGLTADEARAAWRHLLKQELIEGFNMDYVARMSVKGLEYVQSDQFVLTPLAPPRKVYVVRGAEDPIRQGVVQFFASLNFQAVLLNEQAEPGRTIMEQAEPHRDVDFAVLLLNQSDLASINVLMEIGYLIGRLGRAKICALAIDDPVGSPKDLAGVSLCAYDDSGNWKESVNAALKAAGY